MKYFKLGFFPKLFLASLFVMLIMACGVFFLSHLPATKHQIFSVMDAVLAINIGGV